MDTQPGGPTKKISAGSARVKFGQLLDEVFYKGEQFIIERDGRPMAAVVPLPQLAAIQKHAAPPPKYSKRKPKRIG